MVVVGLERILLLRKFERLAVARQRFGSFGLELVVGRIVGLERFGIRTEKKRNWIKRILIEIKVFFKLKKDNSLGGKLVVVGTVVVAGIVAGIVVVVGTVVGRLAVVVGSMGLWRQRMGHILQLGLRRVLLDRKGRLGWRRQEGQERRPTA